LDWAGTGAKPIIKVGGGSVNLKAGIYTFRYDGANFQLQGEGGEYGTAGAAQTLQGYTVGTESGVIPGTIANNGPASVETVNLTVQNQEYTIVAGFHSGLRKIKAVISGLVAGVIKAGSTVGGIAGNFTNDATATAAQMLAGATAWVKGVLITGTMANNTSQTATLEIIGSAKPTKLLPAEYSPRDTITAQLAIIRKCDFTR
jgi:hypothetical protein